MSYTLSATSPRNNTRLILLFLLFLAAMYLLTGSDKSYQAVSEYQVEKHWVQRSCLSEDDCLDGFVCDLNTMFCVKENN